MSNITIRQVASEGWDRLACKAASHLGRNFFESHRGAVPWFEPGVVVAFGNDGADSVQSRLNQARVRESLEIHGVEILGSGVDPEENYTWVIIAKTDDVQAMFDLVWECYPRESENAKGIWALQRNIAASKSYGFSWEGCFSETEPSETSK